MEEKIDLRIRKTHSALMQALQELLCEKSFDEISVSELCDRAQTRRATFYKHFRDKSDLLTYMIQMLQQEYNTKSELNFDFCSRNVSLSHIFKYFLDFLEENKEMVRTILSSNANKIVLDILNEQLEFDLKMHFKEINKDPNSHKIIPDMMAAYYSGAVLNCAQWWITKGDKITKDEAIEQFKFVMAF